MKTSLFSANWRMSRRAPQQLFIIFTFYHFCHHKKNSSRHRKIIRGSGIILPVIRSSSFTSEKYSHNATLREMLCIKNRRFQEGEPCMRRGEGLQKILSFFGKDAKTKKLMKYENIFEEIRHSFFGIVCM